MIWYCASRWTNMFLLQTIFIPVFKIIKMASLFLMWGVVIPTETSESNWSCLQWNRMCILFYFSSGFPTVDNMSEVSSLHDGMEPRGRGGRSHAPPLATVYDQDEAMSTISSVSQQGQRRDDYGRRGGDFMGDRARARSMDNLNDVGRGYRDDYPPNRRPNEPRGQRMWVLCLWAKPPCYWILICALLSIITHSFMWLKRRGHMVCWVKICGVGGVGHIQARSTLTDVL